MVGFLILSISLFLVLYMHVCICEGVCIWGQALQRPEGGTGAPKTDLTGDSNVGAGNWAWVIWKSNRILSPAPGVWLLIQCISSTAGLLYFMNQTSQPPSSTFQLICILFCRVDWWSTQQANGSQPCLWLWISGTCTCTCARNRDDDTMSHTCNPSAWEAKAKGARAKA